MQSEVLRSDGDTTQAALSIPTGILRGGGPSSPLVDEETEAQSKKELQSAWDQDQMAVSTASPSVTQPLFTPWRTPRGISQWDQKRPGQCATPTVCHAFIFIHKLAEQGKRSESERGGESLESHSRAETGPGCLTVWAVTGPHWASLSPMKGCHEHTRLNTTSNLIFKQRTAPSSDSKALRVNRVTVRSP